MSAQHNHIKLTATEISYLWSSYLADTMSDCVLQYFAENIEDSEIKSLVNFALDLAQHHIETIKGIFLKEEIPAPIGFTEKDVNLKAPRLFSDKFYLYYLKNMAKSGLATISSVLPNIYRTDILSFSSECLTASMELSNKVTKLSLEMGLAVRPPSIPYPKEVEFVQKQSFLLEGLGKRPLTGLEITNLYANIQTNQLGTSLATGFSQIAKSTKVKDYILRGKAIALKHIKVFSDYLVNSSLPIPMSFDQEVTDSTESPFSDKLMMYHFNLMIYSGVGNYGMAVSQSQRSDMAVDYSRLLAEVLKYGEDGINIMINNQWLEQPPLAIDRKKLAEG